MSSPPPRILRPFPPFEDWSRNRFGPEWWLRLEFALALGLHVLWNSEMFRLGAGLAVVAALLSAWPDRTPEPEMPAARAAADPLPVSCPGVPAQDGAATIAAAWQVLRETRGARGNAGQREAWEHLRSTAAALAGADLTSAHLRRACFSGDLRALAASGATLAEALFLRGADASGADFAEASLAGATLVGASLEGSDLTGADLRSARLRGANLARANLSKAGLQSVIVEGGSWALARLDGADLTGARFVATLAADTDPLWTGRKEIASGCGLDLEAAEQAAPAGGADMTGVSLKGARLTGADLTGVTGLTQKALDQACADGEIRLPPGLEAPRKCRPEAPPRKRVVRPRTRASNAVAAAPDAAIGIGDWAPALARDRPQRRNLSRR